jgi:fructose-1,6-bisphosphatase/inositol monophosphatase family enzyme
MLEQILSGTLPKLNGQKKVVLDGISRAAVAGGNAIMRIQEKPAFKILTKEGKEISKDETEKLRGQYKTEADDASHEAIAGILGERSYQGIPMVFEEADRTHAHQATYISVDELDGTGRFVKRKPGFMVLIQYVERGVPTLSANFDPMQDRLFYAIQGHGSFVNENLIGELNKSVTLDDARVIINGRDAEKAENAAYYTFMTARFPGRLSAGLASGSRIAALLEGQYDLVVNAGSEELRVWDLGMILNLTEAGGFVSRKDGSPLDFSQSGPIGDLVCSINKDLHEKAIALLKTYR